MSGQSYFDNSINPEGLTYAEWKAAAVGERHISNYEEALTLLRAWEAGEDPTEWRAAGAWDGPLTTKEVKR